MGERSDDRDPGPTADRGLGEPLAVRAVAHDGYVNIHSLPRGLLLHHLSPVVSNGLPRSASDKVNADDGHE